MHTCMYIFYLSKLIKTRAKGIFLKSAGSQTKNTGEKVIATFFRSCRMERSVIIVLAHPRKLNPKPVIEKAENNLIFSFLQIPHVLEIGSIRFLW